MKKIIAFILCAAMLLSASCFAVGVSADSTGSITLTTTKKVTDPIEGTGTLKVTVNVTENTGVNALLIEMAYNAEVLSVKSVTNGVVFSGDNNGSMMANSEINPIKLLFNDNGIENNKNTGKLVTVEFEIIDDMGTFDVNVSVDNKNTYAASEECVPVDVTATVNNDSSKNTQHINTGIPVTIKPTCTEDGRMEKRCTTCNKLLSVTANGKALGHDWDEVERKNATKTEDGYVKYECTRCPETKTEIIPKGTPSPNAATLNGSYKIEDNKLTLNFNLAKNPGINTLVADFVYNTEALQLDNIKNGSVFTEANNGSMFDVNTENMPLRLYFEENEAGNITKNGTVVTFEFTILDDKADYGFEFVVDDKNTIACGEGYVPVSVEFAPSTISELTVMLGDINNDGKVNTGDTNLIIQIVLGSLIPTDQQFAAADINCDGKVNTADINLLKRLVLGQDI